MMTYSTAVVHCYAFCNLVNIDVSCSIFIVVSGTVLGCNGCLFLRGAYFCMGAYKRDMVVVITIGAYIHGVLILCGCLLSRFYGIKHVSDRQLDLVKVIERERWRKMTQ